MTERAVTAGSSGGRGPVAGGSEHDGAVSVGEELLEERRRRRHAGDPRITPEGRAILARLVDGDLVEQFQAALDAQSAADPLLGGDADRDD